MFHCSGGIWFDSNSGDRAPARVAHFLARNEGRYLCRKGVKT